MSDSWNLPMCIGAYIRSVSRITLSMIGEASFNVRVRGRVRVRARVRARVRVSSGPRGKRGSSSEARLRFGHRGDLEP